MPMHDWTRVNAGLYHHFHQDWTTQIVRALNAGLLPPGFHAYIDLRIESVEPDVVALRQTNGTPPLGGGTATATRLRVKTIKSQSTDPRFSSRKANRIVVRHRLGAVIAAIEIVSPGNKSGVVAYESFREKVAELLTRGVHLLVVDPFPPTRRDPDGLYGALREEFGGDEVTLPEGKTLTFTSYSAGEPLLAHLEFLAVGDPLPEMPLFLTPEVHVPVPLEETYLSTWIATPEPLRELLTSPAPPPPGFAP